VKEDLPAVPPLRYLSVAEVKRRVRRIWGGRTHASVVGIAQDPPLPAIQIQSNPQRMIIMNPA
jgi:hypothetical protein